MKRILSEIIQANSKHTNPLVLTGCIYKCWGIWQQWQLNRFLLSMKDHGEWEERLETWGKPMSLQSSDKVRRRNWQITGQSALPPCLGNWCCSLFRMSYPWMWKKNKIFRNFLTLGLIENWNRLPRCCGFSLFLWKYSKFACTPSSAICPREGDLAPKVLSNHYDSMTLWFCDSVNILSETISPTVLSKVLFELNRNIIQ